MNSVSKDGATPGYRHITVPRTARYCLLGDRAVQRPRELWVAVHGYAQLAARFIRHFEPLADGTRWILAPEALSRFYLEHPGRAGAVNARVGATWMTREDREAEIADHVGYLDALVGEVLARVDGPPPRVHVIGFSQGVATVTRWLAHGRIRADRLILWAGRIPPDLLPIGPAHPLRRLEIDIVSGTADEFATPEVLREQRELVEAAGLRPRWHRFAGGHHLHAETLRALAGVGEPPVSDRASGR